MPPTPRIVFVSSTCRDLLDLRAELARYLAENGFQVRVSEDPSSDFRVDGVTSTIESCLNNVETADAIVCVPDARFGWCGEWDGRSNVSATQIEVLHAQRIGKPVFFFLRKPVFSEFELLRADPTHRARWIEPIDEIQRARWVAFVSEIVAFPQHAGRSNWCDQFETVVDRKEMALKRLIDQFPENVLIQALSPDRYTRVTFVLVDSVGQKEIAGYFQNVGVGPAVNLTHGWSHFTHEPSMTHSWPRGGLAEGDAIINTTTSTNARVAYWKYVLGDEAEHVPVVLACEYANRFGDRYRVEKRFIVDHQRRVRVPDGDEVLYVLQPASKQWVPVPA